MAVEMAPDAGLPPMVDRAVTAFADRLEQALGERLVSLAVYGSVLQGGYRPGVSDINLLVLVEQVDPPLLETVASLAGAKVPLSPVVLGEAELPATAVSAPLVLFDLRDHHRLLRGEDPLAGIELELADLGRQLRFELRDKLYRLRAAYLTGHRRPKELAALAAQSYGSVMHLFRNVLRLYGQSAAGNPVQTLGAVARTLRLDLNTLRGLHALRYEQDPEQRRRIGSLYGAYLAVLDTAVARVEALDLDALPAPLEEPPAPEVEADAEAEPGLPPPPPQPGEVEETAAGEAEDITAEAAEEPAETADEAATEAPVGETEADDVAAEPAEEISAATADEAVADGSDDGEAEAAEIAEAADEDAADEADEPVITVAEEVVEPAEAEPPAEAPVPAPTDGIEPADEAQEVETPLSQEDEPEPVPDEDEVP